MTRLEYDLMQHYRPELELPRWTSFSEWEWQQIKDKSIDQIVAEATAAKLAGEDLFEPDVPF